MRKVQGVFASIFEAFQLYQVLPQIRQNLDLPTFRKVKLNIATSNLLLLDQKYFFANPMNTFAHHMNKHFHVNITIGFIYPSDFDQSSNNGTTLNQEIAIIPGSPHSVFSCRVSFEQSLSQLEGQAHCQSGAVTNSQKMTQHYKGSGWAHVTN